MTAPRINLDELERLEREATPGPWRWLHKFFRTRHQKHVRGGKLKARTGHSSKDACVYFLAGPSASGAEFPTEEEYDPTNPKHRAIDEYDFAHVFMLRWSQVKGNSILNAGATEANEAFIAASRNAIPALLAAVRAMLAHAERIQG